MKLIPTIAVLLTARLSAHAAEESHGLLGGYPTGDDYTSYCQRGNSGTGRKFTGRHADS